ncbi:MAG: transglutaminase domain-containing protein [Candidatus Velthaea sp.]
MRPAESADAKRIVFVLQQEFRYDYPGPIRDLHHRLVVAPPRTHGDQRRLAHRLTVAPELPVRWSEDAFGNAVATVDAPLIERAIHIQYEALIERGEAVAPALDASRLHEQLLRTPTDLTQPSDGLLEAARELSREGADAQTLATRINTFVATHMRYVPGVTSVDTTAAQAYAQGTGVCQDYAHIMLALCRSCDIPARYVSGHLLGEGGTHAWVEVLVRTPGGAQLLAFDPTHDRRANLDYVFVAAGRDYADVAPTSGQFTAPYIGRFTTTRFVERVDDDFDADAA